jgi:hypothetical protein
MQSFAPVTVIDKSLKVIGYIKWYWFSSITNNLIYSSDQGQGPIFELRLR